MALVDAKYRFLWVDVGRNGSCSDGGIFGESDLKKAIVDQDIGIPDPKPFPRDDQPMPYAIVADDAFALKSWLMKPFPQRGLCNRKRKTNYRISRARRVVENAFGILAHR
jgi:hypothetical protein